MLHIGYTRRVIANFPRKMHHFSYAISSDHACSINVLIYMCERSYNIVMQVHLCNLVCLVPENEIWKYVSINALRNYGYLNSQLVCC